MTLNLSALGLITPLGRGKDAVARRLFAGAQDGLVERQGFVPGLAARVGAVDDPLPELDPRLQRYDCRNNRMMLSALLQIMPELEAAIERYGRHRIAVILGTSTSGIAEGEEALGSFLQDGSWPVGFRYSQQEPGNLSAFVAEFLGLQGPAYTLHTACSSSSKTFASAARLIQAGVCDAALVGGADTLCRLTLNGFHALEAITPGLCNPFSKNRRGTNIGEGAAVFLMEREGASAIQLLGVGESSDGYHICAPEPDGKGAMRAMELALTDAGLRPDEITYVNLHGTGTPHNDLAEGRAVAGLFGTEIACSSTKSMTGHMLGAAGAGEAAILWLALDPHYSGGLLPPHMWDGAADPEIPPLNLVAPGSSISLAAPCAMLSNSLAFGGSNVSLVLGRAA